MGNSLHNLSALNAVKMLGKKVVLALRCYTTKPKRNYSSLRSGWDAVFGKYLLTTNIVSSGGLMAIGDIIQQEIEYQRNMLPKRYDYGRLCKTGRRQISRLLISHLIC